MAINPLIDREPADYSNRIARLDGTCSSQSGKIMMGVVKETFKIGKQRLRRPVEARPGFLFSRAIR